MGRYQKSFGRLLIRIDKLRTRYIRHRNFLIIVSFIIGALSALAAVLLKLLVGFVEHEAHRINDLLNSSWLTAIFPLIGVGISLLLLRNIFKGRLTRGVGFIIRSIISEKGRIALKHTFGHLLTSSVTVAMGGSVGLEAPIVATGSAIGSNTAHDLRLSTKDTTLLLACGASSGIAAIFNCPIAGIIFALEVLLIDFNIPFFIPLLISTATATVISQVLYPDKFFFLIIETWSISSIPFYIVLGIICGLVSVYTTNMVERIEHFFDKRGLNWKVWLMGSIPLCLLIFILPGLYGEGYVLITDLLNGNSNAVTSHSMLNFISNRHVTIIVICILLIAFKSIAAALTVGAGGNGGIFAPSLFIGGILGFLYVYVINLTELITLRFPNFIVAAMAGVLAGVMHAPLTAIFLLAEITGGYTLFIPLMIVTAISYFMTRRYIPHSLYHKSLVKSKLLTKGIDTPVDFI